MFLLIGSKKLCACTLGLYSFCYRITAGVRQGGILSPVLFAVYMDTLIVRLRKLGIGCKLFDVYYGCLLYADNILLLSLSVNATHRMLAICDQFAVEFDLKFTTQLFVIYLLMPLSFGVQFALLFMCISHAEARLSCRLDV